MTNKEKFADEINKIPLTGYPITITKDYKIARCNRISCKQCKFKPGVDCLSKFHEWLEEEYKEPSYIKKIEKDLLKVISCYGYKYVSIGPNNQIKVHDMKPIWIDDFWQTEKEIDFSIVFEDSLFISYLDGWGYYPIEIILKDFVVKD